METISLVPSLSLSRCGLFFTCVVVYFMLSYYYTIIMKANRQLKSVVPKGFDMSKISESEARPGGWKTMLLKNKNPEHKQRHEPAIIDEEIVEQVANGVPASQIEDQLETRRGYVRDV